MKETETQFLPQHSNSVGNLPDLLNYGSLASLPSQLGTLPKNQPNLVKELEHQVQDLTIRHNVLNEKCTKQEQIIEKYEKRWQQLKEEARRRRSTQSLTDLSSDSQFENEKVDSSNLA